MYEQENAFYEENIETFREKYLDKELVIAGNAMLGVYDDLGTALDETVKTRELGTFTILHVNAQPEKVWMQGENI